jgi:antitoxin component HigA of HigAB toxin-antitoxin module
MTATVSKRNVLRKIDLKKYSRLVAKAAPPVIETEAEFDRADAEVGRLLRKGYDKLSPEEQRLLALLSRLIEDYEDRTFPKVAAGPDCSDPDV